MSKLFWTQTFPESFVLETGQVISQVHGIKRYNWVKELKALILGQKIVYYLISRHNTIPYLRSFYQS